MLKFFGRGAGFSDEHNGAFFRLGSKLILIDCPLITFIRLKNEGLEYFMSTDEKADEIVVAITHTHSDHIGGLSLTIHYARYIWGIPVTVIAPSDIVKENLAYMLENLDGCSKTTYRLLTADEYMAEYTLENMGDLKECWLSAVIPTVHVPSLEGKCFGYCFRIDGKRVVYTGDTNTLEPFLPYIIDSSSTESTILYTECSAYDSSVHMFIEKLLDLEGDFRDNSVEVYLMHLDNVEEIQKKIEGTSYKLAPLA